MMIYFDNSATTKISDEALARYVEVSRECFGNPSSLHSEGFRAEKLLDLARADVMRALGASDSTLIFTSSGSEANNLAILGRAYAKERFRKGGKIITSEGEHASVTAPIEALEKSGFRAVKIPTRNGELDMEALERELDEQVFLVTLMMVNNETGALYDIAKAARLIKARAKNAVLHIDATQSFMKIPFSMASLGADMITVSSHKIEGPKGVGALAVSNSLIKSLGLAPIIFGGGQEGGLRSGTENVPAICAFAEAVNIARKNLEKNRAQCEALREYLIEKISCDGELSAISITNPKSHAPHIVNLTLPGIKSETVLHFLSARGIFVSSGSACSSNSRQVSSALVAYGRGVDEAEASIRVSFSHRNTKDEVDALSDALREALSTLARIRK